MPEISAFQFDTIPARFRPAVLRVQALRADERYQAAYIFGSVARTEASAASDFDVQVLVDHTHPCAAVNHPVINGVKLDLTFLSFEQLAARTKSEIEKGNRVPMVAESIGIFHANDKAERLLASDRLGALLIADLNCACVVCQHALAVLANS